MTRESWGVRTAARSFPFTDHASPFRLITAGFNPFVGGSKKGGRLVRKRRRLGVRLFDEHFGGRADQPLEVVVAHGVLLCGPVSTG